MAPMITVLKTVSLYNIKRLGYLYDRMRAPQHFKSHSAALHVHRQCPYPLPPEHACEAQAVTWAQQWRAACARPGVSDVLASGAQTIRLVLPRAGG
eukprot:4635937-Pleurochrysis_carterae.AAC.2